LKFFLQRKFFYKNINSLKKNKIKSTFLVNNEINKINFLGFSKFILKNGVSIKTRLLLSFVLSNFNAFLYKNNKFIFENYPNIKWIVDDVLEKKLNALHIFELVTNLIKPPFVIKSVVVPKKLRKKTKRKYLIKIVYKNENKRLKNAYKQLYYYSNKFNDNKFNVRLYKALVFSFLEWKNSYLFKLKSMVFKKFFKF
jgi:hypothetical protein